MEKVKRSSIKRSMAAMFITTLCLIGLLSGVTIFAASRCQQEIMRSCYLTIKAAKFEESSTAGRYVLNLDDNDVEWHLLGTGEKLAYYSCYFAMIGLPVLYVVLGMGGTAALYYRFKLKAPLTELQKGIESIRGNDLDFSIAYAENNELGDLCLSMEKMRTQLRRNNRQLWEMLEQRKLLNTSVAHDLRTPITVIKGYIDYLSRNIPQGELSEEGILDTVASMRGAADRMERYVDCLRDLDRLDDIQPDFREISTVRLAEEIRRCLELDGVAFINSLQQETVRADKDLLLRVIENLMQNATRFAKERIEVTLYSDDDSICVCVTDDGPGFSCDGLKKAGSLFYSESTDSHHFGLGLYICKLLCEKMGGCLTLENRESNGACVTAAIKKISPLSEN